MRQTTERVRTIDLDRDQMLIFDGGREGRVRVLYGGAWLTEQDRPGDHFVAPGLDFRLGRRPSVLQALSPLRLQLSEGRRLVPRWWLAVRRWAVRWQWGPLPRHAA